MLTKFYQYFYFNLYSYVKQNKHRLKNYGSIHFQSKLYLSTVTCFIIYSLFKLIDLFFYTPTILLFLAMGVSIMKNHLMFGQKEYSSDDFKLLSPIRLSVYKILSVVIYISPIVILLAIMFIRAHRHSHTNA